MFRLMVRSTEGWRLVSEGGCARYVRKYLWVTWTTFPTRDEADTKANELRQGGSVCDVIPEAAYPTFNFYRE